MQADKQKTFKQNRASLYQTVWRWHFYAGIIFAPFLIILAFSGSVYLFKPQIESILYQDQYYVQEEGSTTLSPSSQISKVKEAYPNGTVTSIKFYDEPSRTTEIGVSENGQIYSVFVNPYNGELTGRINNEERFTEIFKKIHSELLVGGTIANRWVELTACWAFILLITGLYMWWPRNKSSIWGTVLPRLNKKGRTFWRDMHAVPAFWLSTFILILITTGLTWSGVVGEQIKNLASSTNTGYPPFATIFAEKPESIVKTKDIAENVPWATENLAVPSSAVNGYVPLAVDDISYIASNEDISQPYAIYMPQGEKGVFTISTDDTSPKDSATLHVDQYTGSILSDVRFDDYGIMAKGISVGIALHEGRLFGLANQIIGLIVCIGLIGFIVSAFIMWRKRKPDNKLGAPPRSIDEKITRAVFFFMIAMGVIMPLVGISIIAIFLLDRFVLKKVKPVKTWLY
ncbi:PepSY domain-containing protein [Radiobacillus kanasensis]|nr:PepSY domain-containing protein [Radiobacillus kanasensis]UFU01301.1 PepSY domain-containing protein [Radiobacillus kanasensis]